jgi:hypothetical protein
MSTTVAGEEVRAYLEAVRAHLDYVPPDDRDELLEDLEEHLLEVAAESDGTLEDRLGPPSAYAEELRASAGLPGPGTEGARLMQRISGSQILRRAAVALDSQRARGLRRFIRELSPGWWVARGYLGVLAWGVIVARDEGRSVREAIPYPRLLGSYAWGVLVAIVAIVVSVKLGRLAARDRRAWIASLAATVVVLAVGFTVLGDLGDLGYAYADDASALNPYLQHADGTPIANICPYSSDGKLLNGVLLFDQFGRPITNTSDTVDDQAIEAAKPAIGNAYPKSIGVVQFGGAYTVAPDGTEQPQTVVTPLACPPSVTASGPSGRPSPIP